MATAGIMPWILRHSRANWKQARMIAKHHDDRWTRTHLKVEPSDIACGRAGGRSGGCWRWMEF